ncbi:hypothetical protein RUND412_006826 [Rhizina undulata]
MSPPWRYRGRPGKYAGELWHTSFSESDDVSKEARNSTLGFGEILYLSMPYRTDRQDAMNILATYTNMKLKLVQGVDGSTINEKAKPDNTKIEGNELGCWRAHADAWRKVIDLGVETALILEDDIDWDVDVHQIFETLSVEMRKGPFRLHPPSAHEDATAPYGLDWDVLWVGQCLHNPNPSRLDLYHPYHDPSAPFRNQTRKEDIEDMEKNFGLQVWKDSQRRVLSPAYDPTCTMGYAITRKGAEHLMYHVGYHGLDNPVDNAMAQRFKDGGLRGYVVVPPIFNMWRVGGGKDSDINKAQGAQPATGRGNDGGWSPNIRNSARKAFAKEFEANYWQEAEELPIMSHETPITT